MGEEEGKWSAHSTGGGLGGGRGMDTRYQNMFLLVSNVCCCMEEEVGGGGEGRSYPVKLAVFTGLMLQLVAYCCVGHG